MVCWETKISPDNPVRLIDAFVNYLDLPSLGFTQKGKKREGRPAFESGLLLKLYFYGYLNRIRSSRQLEKAARRNTELFWLLEEATPGYRTIATFRKIHPKPLQQVFRQFNQFLKGEGLFQGNIVAVDGTKIAAQNSKKNNYNEKKIQQHLEYIERQTESYLSALDALDESETSEPESYLEVSERLDHLTQRQQKYTALSKELASVRSNNQAQISTTDPDARALPKKMNIVEMSYNIQTSVEATDKLITNFAVTNENDTHALSTIAEAANEVLEQTELKVLADKGYDTGSELQKCADQGIETYVSPRKKIHPKKDPQFSKSKFYYHPETPTYTCPAQETLKTNGTWYTKYGSKDKQHRKSYQFQRFSASFKTCNSCVFKERCVGNSNLSKHKGRQIERSEYQDAVDANIERYQLNKPLYRTRQQIVEHPFGTIKRQWGYHYTLLKTKEKVSGEFALIFTCYNLRRAMSIFGVEELIKRLEAASDSFLSMNVLVLRHFGEFIREMLKMRFGLSPQKRGRRFNNNANRMHLWAG